MPLFPLEFIVLSIADVTPSLALTGNCFCNYLKEGETLCPDAVDTGQWQLKVLNHKLIVFNYYYFYLLVKFCCNFCESSVAHYCLLNSGTLLT